MEKSSKEVYVNLSVLPKEREYVSETSIKILIEKAFFIWKKLENQIIYKVLN